MARSLKPWRIDVADHEGATSLVVSLAEATVSEAIPRFTTMTRVSPSKRSLRARRGPNAPLSPAGQGSLHDVVRREVPAGVAHQFRQATACPVDPALDGSDRAVTDSRGLLIGETFGADQKDRLALVG